MSRLDIRGPDTIEIEIPSFGGMNTAKTFSEIELFESPKMLNALPRKQGGLAKRDGTIPLTITALGGAIKVLCNLRKNGTNTILATSGTAMHKYNSTTKAFDALTMTNALASANIDYAQFKDQASNEVLVIADGGSLKFCNGTAVANITPAANDASPLPANDLATLNTQKPAIGCIVHNTRVVIWGASSDQINHSKVGFYDYFAQTDFQRFVRENDYVMTCASFAGALLVFMRRHIGILFGHDIDDWSQDFLDTSEGCVNASSVQTVVYPDGREEVFYQTDRGVNAVYTIDTISLDSSARYSTRSVTKSQIDWDGLGLTKEEWAAATSFFHEGRYWLVYKQGSTWQGLVFDTNDSQWYPIDNVKANSFYHDEDYFYFAADDGHLKVFDSTLYSDWNEAAKTTGTPINWYWYSKLMTPKLTGLDHFWDIIMIEARNWQSASTIDLEVNTFTGRFLQSGALKTSVMVVGASEIGAAQIHNANITYLVNNAKRIGPMGIKGQYAQTKLSNNRDEPVEIYSIKYETRLMTKY